MRLISVDPGINGGAALLDFSIRGALPRLDVIDIPLRTERNSTGKERRYVDPHAWQAAIRRWTPDAGVFELSWAMPAPDRLGHAGEHMEGQGAVAAGRTQRAHGVLEGILTCELPAGGLRYVTPQVWKRHFGLIGGAKNKRSSCDLIIELFPEATRFFLRAKDNNRAEAALLGVYEAAHRGLIRLAPADAPPLAPATGDAMPF